MKKISLRNWFASGQRRHRRPTRVLAGGEFLETRRLLAFDPTTLEQAMLEHVNRMRMNPQGELNHFFDTVSPILVATDPEVQRAVDHFDVNPQELLRQWSELTPVPPVAWNEALSEAAAAHNGFMVEADEQAHQLPGEPDLSDRVDDAGYTGNFILENVYAFAESDFHGHAGFAIDWGEGSTGIQNPPGHRDNMMDSTVKEVGMDVIEESDDNTDVGPYVITQEFARRSDYNPQILGVFWEDGFENGRYDPGEGYGGITITVTGGGDTFTTTTMSAGGYQLEVPPGTYQVTAHHVILGTFTVGDVVVANQNVKVDFELGSANRRPAAAPDSFAISENESRELDVLSNDFDTDGSIDVTTVTITQPPQRGTATVNPATGRVTYSATVSLSGNDSFFYTVKDDEGAESLEAEVSLTIEEVNINNPPTITTTTFQANEGTLTRWNIEPYVTDSDGIVNWASLQITQMPDHGSLTFDVGSRRLAFTGTPNYAGTDSFSIRVRDNEGAFSNNANFGVNVLDVNDAPVASDDLFATVGGTGKSLDVRANDSDRDGNIGDAVISITSSPQSGSANVAGGSIVYAPFNGFVGLDTFRYHLRDEQLAVSQEATVRVYVAHPERPWQNPANTLDVTPDGTISPLDALLVINFIGLTNLSLPSLEPGLESAPPPFIDVNGNNVVDPLDALLVINDLPTSAAPLSARAAAVAAADGVADKTTDSLSASVVPTPKPGEYSPSSGTITEPRLAMNHVASAASEVVVDAAHDQYAVRSSFPSLHGEYRGVALGESQVRGYAWQDLDPILSDIAEDVAVARDVFSGT